MKAKIFISFLFLLVSVYVFPQPPKNMIPRNRLPQLVKESFDSKYPEVPRANWKCEVPNEFEAEIELENRTNWITFNEFGEILFKKKALKEEEVPAAVNQTLQGAFKDFKAGSFKKVEHTTKGESYEMRIEKKVEKYLLSIDPSGNILNKTTIVE